MAASGAPILASPLSLERLFSGLRYGSLSSRDSRIDLLRGFCVFAMVVDHVGGASWLYSITGGNQFVVSAAEGFIFLSGFLVGVVYRRVTERSGLAAGIRKALERAGRLYVLAVVLAIGFGLASTLAGQNWGADEIGDPIRFALEVLSLQRTFYLADVMLLYALLLAATPLALLALQHRHGGAAVVGGSLAVWLAFQLSPHPIDVPWRIYENNVFRFAPWQVLFFLALVIGWHRASMGAAIGRALLHPAAIALSVLFGAAAIAVWSTDPPHLTAVFGDQAALQLYDWFDKSRLPLPRLLATGAFFHLAFAIVTLGWGLVVRLLGWLLTPFGERTLIAYSSHLFLLAGVGLVTAQVPGFDPQDPAMNTAAQVGVVIVLWLFVLSVSHWPRWPAVLRVGAGRRAAPAPRQIAWRRPEWWHLGAAFLGVVSFVMLGRAVLAAVTPPTDAVVAVATEAPTIVYVRPTTLAQEPLGSIEPVDLAAVSEYAGRVWNDSFWSPILEREMPYLIYLPPDYEATTKHYPTVYLLHGVGGHYGEWFGYGMLNEADRMMVDGEIDEMIIVLPQGDQDYWIDRPDGGPQWADYVAKDVVGYVDRTYRTIPIPQERAIGGLSMGAHGALQIGFNFPQVFGIIGAHSPSIRTFDESPIYFGDEAQFRLNDPVSLAETIPADTDQEIWIDRGEDDIWFEQTDRLAATLSERGIPYVWNVLPGEHDGYYWEANAPLYLHYYSQALDHQLGR